MTKDTSPVKILVIDDEAAIRHSFADYLEDRDYQAHLKKLVKERTQKIDQIVKGHNGFIKTFSETGYGSTFQIFLPAIKKENSLSTPGKKQTNLSKGTEHIMLVDDEETILMGIRKYILKPVSGQELSAIIRELLDGEKINTKETLCRSDT